MINYGLLDVNREGPGTVCRIKITTSALNTNFYGRKWTIIQHLPHSMPFHVSPITETYGESTIA